MAARKKASKTDTQVRIAEFRKKANAIIARITKDRDEFRALVVELDGVVDSLDRGVEEFDEARRRFEDGLDALSEYL